MENESDRPKYGEPGYKEYWDARRKAWLDSLSPIERKFLEMREEVREKIALKLSEAHSSLEEAEKISLEYGIPFDSSISPLTQMYRPTSFDEKWSELSKEFVRGLELSERVGWEYSAVCY